MSMKPTLCVLAALVAFGSGTAWADLLERPGGIRIGQRMVLRPTLSLNYTYDDNVYSDNDSNKTGDSSFSVNPALALTYQADSWSLNFNVYYSYHTYLHCSDTRNLGSYGEALSYHWQTSKEDEGGWSFMLSESFSQTLQDDDMTNNDGRGIGRDRRQFNFATGLEHRFSEKLHANVNASTYYLDYDNDDDKYGAQYGWSRYTAGGGAGYAFSPFTDVSFSGSYNGYFQDNDTDRGAKWRGKVDPDNPSRRLPTERKSDRNPSGESTGYTLHAGIGTRATERISYRVMGGMSEFKYGDVHTSRGFTYSASGNWKIGETWQTMLLASSYYHPSEQNYGAASRSDCLSWGLSHSMVRNKLTATLDVTYRHTEQDYVTYASDDYETDVVTLRIGASYSVNRFVSIHASGEAGRQVSGGSGETGNDCDYDRLRGTIGVTFSY